MARLRRAIALLLIAAAAVTGAVGALALVTQERRLSVGEIAVGISPCHDGDTLLKDLAADGAIVLTQLDRLAPTARTGRRSSGSAGCGWRGLTDPFLRRAGQRPELLRRQPPDHPIMLLDAHTHRLEVNGGTIGAGGTGNLADERSNLSLAIVTYRLQPTPLPLAVDQVRSTPAPAGRAPAASGSTRSCADDRQGRFSGPDRRG
ncbi:hypothetical protein DSM104299_02362 [Baekduia alba]|uniref:hypothetical protein n=1 Tax=Baekduia alba TaxID=2997333 RepID=UPI0023425616|nr:hypothetical protein [Baekduia alba]WCB93646.1 hypothetical protein DSM104299_02362 [Baekduia alba]